MSVIRCKPGVRFDVIDPAGFRLLGSLDRVARGFPVDLTITSGTDGHGPADPHTLGKGYDIRTHGLTKEQKVFVLREVLIDLQEDATDAPLETSIGLATRFFYGQLEHPGQPGEHLHFQCRKGRVYPPGTARTYRNAYPRKENRKA